MSVYDHAVSTALLQNGGSPSVSGNIIKYIKMSHVSQQTPREKKILCFSFFIEQKEKIQLTVWSPEDAPLTAKDVNELDVILFESGSLVNHYR